MIGPLKLDHLRAWPGKLFRAARAHKNHVFAIVLIAIWCLPYFTTGSRVEWGDFGFFAQAYEAMRTSILHYHQFPWWNPWMSGGVPLYANPQMGLFSIQMVLVLFFGAPLGLKLALAIYTLLGYLSMYVLLHRYFKVERYLSTFLGLAWIFCSFFVSHLPSHFTFAWYMLAPFFIYLSLTVRTWRGGLALGGAFAVMALSQIHNPFFHISLICGVILAARFIRGTGYRKQLVICFAAAALVFVILAGHRTYFTVQNVHDFSRYGQGDPPSSPYTDMLGILAPFSVEHHFRFIAIPARPEAAFGFGEATATIGIACLLAGIVALIYLAFLLSASGKKLKAVRLPLWLIGLGLLCFALGLGSFWRFSPYSILKHVPIFGEMRVSTRWFLFFDLAVLLFIGTVSKLAGAKTFPRFALRSLVFIGVLELFFINVGYQAKVLNHDTVKPPKPNYSYPFTETNLFGASTRLPDGSTITDTDGGPHAFREYDATLYNQGVIFANDALTDLSLDPAYRSGHPTCGIEQGCSFIKTGNAKLVYWSPNKIVLHRTAPGPIALNMDDSRYFLIDGKRRPLLRVTEPTQDFFIKDSGPTITLVVQPAFP